MERVPQEESRRERTNGTEVHHIGHVGQLKRCPVGRLRCDLIKASAVLHEVYRSIDLVAYLRAELDRRSGSNYRAACLAQLRQCAQLPMTFLNVKTMLESNLRKGIPGRASWESVFER